MNKALHSVARKGSYHVSESQVEDELFQVPKRYFENNAINMKDSFPFPKPQHDNDRGLDIQTPVFLARVKKADFTRLLEMIYPV